MCAIGVVANGSNLALSWKTTSAGGAPTSFVLDVSGALLNLTLPFSTLRVASNVPSGTYNLSVLAVNPCGAGVETVPQAITVP